MRDACLPLLVRSDNSFEMSLHPQITVEASSIAFFNCQLPTANCKLSLLYIFFSKKQFVYKSDVLIIGTGIAGLSTAIQLAIQRNDLSITIVSKTNKDECNTRYAQGGVAAVWDRIKDDFEKHIFDTMDAGDGFVG